MKRLFSLALTCLFLPFTVSAAQTWANDGSPATVVELFTSEGCSSCPPADRVLGSLKEESGLWEEVIPLAFHVDYWDYLGWKDRFARTEFSVRQRNKVRKVKPKAPTHPAGLLMVMNGPAFSAVNRFLQAWEIRQESWKPHSITPPCR